jgi:hypothetical protein
MASMYTDNVWIQSQDKAIKAGRLLGEVLEKRVQGQRPVVLVRATPRAVTASPADLAGSLIDRPESRSSDSIPRLALPGLAIKRRCPARDC